MAIRTTVIGSYPKVTEDGSDNLPGTIDRWQRQLVGDDSLEQELQKVTRRVLREQEEAGLALVSDGQIRWEDLAHGIVRSAGGIKRGTLRRFFDNNVYYRRLEHEGTVQWKKAAVAEEFRQASQWTKKPIKATLPGPLTLVLSTEMNKNQSAPQLLAQYADLLRKEGQALEKAGAQAIQLEEPAWRPGEPLLKEAVEAINRIFQGIQAKRWVAFYFSDLSRIMPELAGFKEVDVISLDLVTGPGLLNRLEELKWSGELALGLVDARNTKLEDPKELCQQIQKAAQAFPAERLWLAPNCSLEFLPHDAAIKKLKLLKEASQRCQTPENI